MNKAQRRIGVGAVGLFVVASLFPPWLIPSGSGGFRLWRSLFNPPPYESVRIDWVIIGFEWFVILIAACVLMWLFRQGQSSDGGRGGG